MKSFTTLQGVGRSELLELIEAAIECAGGDGGGRKALAGRAVALMFFEPSTRTRLSFELAVRRLNGDVLTFDPATSSTVKGETLFDTVTTVASMGADILVVRHGEEGVPDQVHRWTNRPVVNAGDGRREHPTQGLVDAVTLVRHFGDLDGLRMGVVGDVAHSRVAGSLMHCMPALGADLMLIGPADLLPEGVEAPIRVSSDLDSAIPQLDVVYLLRVQRERGAVTGDEYQERFQMDETRMAAMRDGAVVMHPGPMNRGVEITDAVADGPRSLILSQVANGVPSRMAVLAAMSRSLP